MIFEKLTAIVAEQFSVDESEITENTTFEDLGADSLDVVELIMAVEEEFDVQVADEDAEGIETIGDVVNFLRDKV
ncbi:MAG: acyl carrier protein [Ruminococcaceae bacterium]|nr:acyl carrier protein [Oscillospiraceae bacterium]